MLAVLAAVGCDARIERASGTQQPTLSSAGTIAGTPIAPQSPTAPAATAAAAVASPTAGPPASAWPTRPSTTVKKGPATRREVALTFDSDTAGGQGLDIMEWLAFYRTPATIFMTGDWTDNTSFGPLILAVIEAHPDLYTLGNHSYSHPNFKTLTPDQIVTELRTTERSIRRYCSQDPKPYWRPPYGEFDAAVLRVAGLEGYSWTVLADVWIADWAPPDGNPPGPSADDIVRTVVTKAKPGSIIDLHLGGYKTFDALPGIVAGLEQRGLRLVNIDQMFRP